MRNRIRKTSTITATMKNRTRKTATTITVPTAIRRTTTTSKWDSGKGCASGFDAQPNIFCRTGLVKTQDRK